MEGAEGAGAEDMRVWRHKFRSWVEGQCEISYYYYYCYHWY